MILYITLSVSLAAATALLVHQFRSRALVEDAAPANDDAEDRVDERQAA